MNGQAFSIDKPEDLYLGLKQLDELQGETTLAMYERVGVSVSNGFNWMSRHWFFSLLVFSLVGGFIYRYLTFHGPKNSSLLPSFHRSVNHHKD